MRFSIRRWHMKIVVWKSPRLLAPLLRKFFKIKKNT
ncbi:MAG: stage V sporulation protein SpoVM [Clostridia bacterium]|nr:stage V sporulation protein SpoVM [Clostridia bacterium]MBQ4574181.1 stage V sporulation protein SpoVM [Clostridia bacterium]